MRYVSIIMSYINKYYVYQSALICILCIHARLYAAEPIVINFSQTDKAIYTKWDASATFTKIQRWAKDYGLDLLADNNPVIDNEAHFVSKYGSKVEINNLDPQRNYTLYIDFVKFKKGEGGIVSRLVIYADNKKISEIKYGEQNQEGLYSVAIPRDCIYDGSVTLLFKEFATTTGVWGIWDMIVTDGELPEQIKLPNIIPPIKSDEEKKIKEVSPEYKRDEIPKRKKKEESGQDKTPDPAKKKDDDKIIDPVVPEIHPPDETRAPKLPEVEKQKDIVPNVKDPDVRD